jgi:hypothetical protein
MFRKLLILGTIAALFTIMTAAPAFGLSVNTGPPGDQTAKQVISVGDFENGKSNPAHGPACGAQDLVDLGAIDCQNSPGVSTDNPGRPSAPIPSPVNEGVTVNVGAWNAVFGPGGMSNDDSAICGIGTTAGDFDPLNTCDLP